MMLKMKRVNLIHVADNKGKMLMQNHIYFLKNCRLNIIFAFIFFALFNSRDCLHPLQIFLDLLSGRLQQGPDDVPPHRGNTRQSLGARAPQQVQQYRFRLILGVVGSAVGNWLAGTIGIAATGSVGAILIGVGGACVVILVARWLFH